MNLFIEPIEPRLREEAAAFNERMRRANAPTDFVLSPGAEAFVQTGAVTTTHYIARDQDDHVRGGMMCQEYPALVAGRTERVVNISAPISEGIVDSAYTFVGPLLIKHAVGRNRHAFVVGMGMASNPLPRLLKAMGWTIRVVPFYYRLIHAGRCLRHLRPVRTTRTRRLLGGIASRTGVAALGARIAHRPSTSAHRAAARFETEPIDTWDDSANAAWSAFAPGLSFGVKRTPDTLPFFYPLNGSGLRAWKLKRNGTSSGWFGMLVTRMSANEYFGDLTVATLTDCVGSAAAVEAATMIAVEHAKACGADILITNQQHVRVRESCAAAGWRPGPSNFLLATSRSLSEALHESTTYVTRRDGDGLVNLARGGPRR